MLNYSPKMMCASVGAFILAVSYSNAATSFEDAFEADSSSSYSGTGFVITGGALNMDITLPVRNIMYSSPFAFGVGSTATVDVLDTRSIFELESFLISTDVAGADRIAVSRGTYNGGVSHGYTFEQDGGQLTSRILGTANPVTMKISRTALDTFEMEVWDSGAVVASYTHTDASWAGVSDYYVGVRGLRDTGPATVRFDNLKVTAVPEASSAALCALGGVGLAFRRRR